MPVPKGQRFGGRQKGTPNKRLALHELLDAVFKKVDPVEKLVSLLHKPLDTGTEARVLLRLMEYAYGQPSANVNITGHITHEYIDPDRLTDAQLAEAERLVESAVTRSDP